jgi:hypothetical protein
MVVAVAVAASGCASTLSTMQTAVPVKRGHVQVNGGIGVYLPLGPAADAIAQGAKQAKKGVEAATGHDDYQLTEEDAQALLTAGIGLASMPPGVAYEIAVRTGIFDDLDVGVKYSTAGSLKVDAKYRFFHKGPEQGQAGVMSPNFDFAIGLAGAKYFFSSPVIQVLEYVQLGDFSRWDVEVPAYFSIEWGEILKFWVAPKYLYSRTSFDEQLVSVSEFATDLSGYDVTLPTVVNTHFFGSSVGIGAGYKYVWLMLELTAGYTYCRPTVFGRERNIGGLTLYPSIGLQVKI